MKKLIIVFLLALIIGGCATKKAYLLESQNNQNNHVWVIIEKGEADIIYLPIGSNPSSDRYIVIDEK